MWHEILITDLTRMSKNRVCLAGVTQRFVTVRPDIPSPGISERDLFRDNRVIIRPRAVVGINLVGKSFLEAPHTEDRIWVDPEQTRFLRLATDDAWKLALRRTMNEAVADIFETDMYNNKAIEPGTGVRSLGTIQPSSIDDFVYELDGWDASKYRYRLSFTDVQGTYFEDIPVTDLTLRCHADDLRSNRRMSTEEISERLLSEFRQAETWLRLGLTRPFNKSRSDDAWCYLQVNGIYTFPDYLEGRCFADFAS